MRRLTLFLIIFICVFSLSGCGIAKRILDFTDNVFTKKSFEDELGKPLPDESPEIYGNTTGNIHSGGRVAKSGEWLYYFNPEDEGLFRSRIDGSEKQKLEDGWFDSINVVGDWVYYIKWKYEVSPQLYKIRTDGTEEEMIFDSKGHIHEATVVDNWIYFRLANGYEIYKIRTDGTDKKQVSTDFRSGNYCVYGDWVYYYNYADSGKIYKVKTDGTERTKLNDEEHTGDIIVDGDWIYYTNYGDNHTKKLYRMRCDGTEVTRFSAAEDLEISALNMSGDYLYFAATLDCYPCPHGGYTYHHTELYRMKKDGSELETLIKKSDLPSAYSGGVGEVYIIDDWIFVTVDNYNKDGSGASVYYKMHIDGKDLQKAFE